MVSCAGSQMAGPSCPRRLDWRPIARGRVSGCCRQAYAGIAGRGRVRDVPLGGSLLIRAYRSFQSRRCPEAISPATSWSRSSGPPSGQTELPPAFRSFPNGHPTRRARPMIANRARGMHSGATKRSGLYVSARRPPMLVADVHAERRRQSRCIPGARGRSGSGWFKAGAGAVSRRAFQIFVSAAPMIRGQQGRVAWLRHLLETHGVSRAPLAWPKEKGLALLRGSHAFAAEHSAVFFGLDRSID